MPSPFPGMDPYLERHWRGVHAYLITGAGAQLNRRLGGGLRARVEERLLVEYPWDESRTLYPDVQVIERNPSGRRSSSGVESGVALVEPLVIPLPEPTKQRFIEIIDPASDGKVITVIEFVSPSNKLPGDGLRKYRQKQADVVHAGINLVEIDLTRSGERSLASAVAGMPREYRESAYLTCVFRAAKQRFEVYRMPLRERLPSIRIPLRERDEDVMLDVQEVVDRAYEDGRYDDIDYTKACVPALAADDATWAAGLRSAAP